MGRRNDDELDAVHTPGGPPARNRKRFGAQKMQPRIRDRDAHSEGGRLYVPGFEGSTRVAGSVGHHRTDRRGSDWAERGQEFDFSDRERPPRGTDKYICGGTGQPVLVGASLLPSDQVLEKQFNPPKQHDDFLGSILARSSAAKRQGAKRVLVATSSAASLEIASAPSPPVPARPPASQPRRPTPASKPLGSSGWVNKRKGPEKPPAPARPRVTFKEPPARREQRSPDPPTPTPSRHSSRFFSSNGSSSRRLSELAPTNRQVTFSLRTRASPSGSAAPTQPRGMSTRSKSKPPTVGASADQPIALDDSESDSDVTPLEPNPALQSKEVDVDEADASEVDLGELGATCVARVDECDVLFGLFQCTATLLFQNDRVCISNIRANHEKWPFQSHCFIDFAKLVDARVCWDSDGDDDKEDSPSFIPVGDELPFIALRCPPPEPARDAVWQSFYNPSNECNDLAKKFIIFKPTDATSAKETVGAIVSIIRSFAPVDTIEKAESRQYLRALEGEPFSFARANRPKSSRKRKKPGADGAGGSDDDSDGDETVLTYPPPPCSSDIVTIIRRDVLRLKPERYLNDNVIDYYFKRLMRDTFRDEPVIQQRVLFLSSHFYSHFRMGRGNSVASRLEAGYNNVSKWLARADFFSRSMIFIPINKDWHWSLAVILNPKCAAMKAREDEESACSCITVLDPLGSYHNRKIITRNLRAFLRLEWQNSHAGDADDGAGDDERKAPAYDVDRVRTVVANTPRQENGYDCGVYVLKFAEVMLRNCLACKLLERPDGAVGRQVVDGNLEALLPRDAFTQEDVDEARRYVRKCIDADASRLRAQA